MNRKEPELLHLVMDMDPKYKPVQLNRNHDQLPTGWEKFGFLLRHDGETEGVSE